MIYGDTAKLPWGNERIEAGAFNPLGDVLLNRQHERSAPLARTGGGGLELTDTAEGLRIAASLPATRDADDVLELVRRRILRGLSDRVSDNRRAFRESRQQSSSGLIFTLWPSSMSPAYPSIACRGAPGGGRGHWKNPEPGGGGDGGSD